MDDITKRIKKNHNRILLLCCAYLLNHVQLFVTPWTPACQATLSFTISWCFAQLMPTDSVMPSNQLILCHPSSSCPQSFPASGSFSNESALCIRCPKYWSFTFSIHPSNEYSGLISFRIDLFGLLAVQGTLKNLLQDHSSKASILLHSAFFMIQTSHPYMSTGKNIALTIWLFVRKMRSLLLNMLSGFAKAFLPRSKYLLIPWLPSPSLVILRLRCDG